MNFDILCSSCLLRRIPTFTKRCLDIQKRLRSPLTYPEAISLTKCVENPVIVMAEEAKVDLIGPPHSISNLRPIVRKQLLHETLLQQKLRQLQDQTQAWNEKFWMEHNTRFKKEKEKYVKLHLKLNDGKTLLADEMSEFYKSFLDRHWQMHVEYNFEWYKRNFTILIFSIRVGLENFRNL